MTSYLQNYRKYLVALAIVISSCTSSISLPNDVEGFYFVDRADQRLEERETYFAHENDQIRNRRKLFFGANEANTENTIGLALSGGGIRSSAFQLGILSGIHEEKYKKKSLLNRVDYISGVSGRKLGLRFLLVTTRTR